MFDKQLVQKAKKLIKLAYLEKIKIVTAESCTGGLISSLLTSIAGSSTVFDRGFVTYSNEAKIELLNVDRELIRKKGAVDREVSIQMTMGALAHSNANLGVSVTGIAGPSGGTESKPVGLVHIAVCLNNKILKHEESLFKGNRQKVRLQTVEKAVDMMINLIENR